MREVTCPSFEEATGQLLAFVLEVSPTCQAVRWVVPGDYLTPRADTVLVPGDRWMRGNGRLAAADYTRAVDRGLGVKLHAEFLLDDAVYSWVWGPADELAAENAMMAGGLKLERRIPLLRARRISWLSWRRRRSRAAALQRACR